MKVALGVGIVFASLVFTYYLAFGQAKCSLAWLLYIPLPLTQMLRKYMLKAYFFSIYSETFLPTKSKHVIIQIEIDKSFHHT